jgi:TPP-dependent pyruvate/acetoin dehydrogenase alpha subunit
VLKYHQERDPIERVRKLILAHDLATAAELKVQYSFGNIHEVHM